MHAFYGCANIFDLALSKEKVAELEAKMSEPGFWDQPEQARKMNLEFDEHRSLLQTDASLEEWLEELEMFLEILDEENEEELASLDQLVTQIEDYLSQAELKALLSAPYDREQAILTIHSGSGGDDAQDWAQMLLRMYLRWGESQDFSVELVEVSPSEYGIHSATILVNTPDAYGYLKSEIGVHRLVRISPFDSAKRRHTSFAKVEVVPQFEEAEAVEIRSEDLKVDTYRASGAGGQHVNKTDSAVRLTHIPTGVVVACQNERSQHANRDRALKILKSKLLELKIEQRREHIEELKGENTEAAWGYQIRNYVLHPYSQVKDRRTGKETSDVQGVLDGKLQSFMRSYLEEWARLGEEPKPS